MNPFCKDKSAPDLACAACVACRIEIGWCAKQMTKYPCRIGLKDGAIHLPLRVAARLHCNRVSIALFHKRPLLAQWMRSLFVPLRLASLVPDEGRDKTMYLYLIDGRHFVTRIIDFL